METKREAIANADAHLNNAGLPSYSELRQTLAELTDAAKKFAHAPEDWPEITRAESIIAKSRGEES